MFNSKKKQYKEKTSRSLYSERGARNRKKILLSPQFPHETFFEALSIDCREGSLMEEGNDNEQPEKKIC